MMPEGASLFSGVVMIGLERKELDHVHIHAFANAPRVGSLFGEPLDKIRPFLEFTRKGFIPFDAEPAVETTIFKKLLYNICLNPLGGLLGCTYGELTENAPMRDLMIRLADEALQAIRAARGLTLFKDGVDYIENDLIARRIAKVGSHRSSMLQDIQAGRKTEIDYLNGAISALGKDCGVPTPCNDTITALIHAAEDMKARR